MQTIRYPLACSFLALAVLGSAARADETILSDNANWTLQGQFDTTTDDQSPTNFTGSTVYNGVNALTAGNSYAGSFGNSGDNTYWQNDTVLDLQTQFELTGNDLSSIDYSIAIDNDYELFVNGNLVNTVYHEGGATFSSPALLADLQAGENTIDVIAVDRGGGTFFDMNITGADGTAGPASVPDAGNSALLLAAGLAGLFLAAPKLARVCRTGAA